MKLHDKKTVYSDSLKHYGVLGQKWGVRRWQNADGTLTEAGKKHYYKEDGSLNTLGKLEKYTFDSNVQNNWTDAYNRAADKFDRKIYFINKKYDNEDLGYDEQTFKFTTEAGKKYVKEVSDYWDKTYTDELIKQFGFSIENGAAWVDSMPFMHTYAYSM